MVDKKNGPRLSTRLSISIATYYICSKSQKKSPEEKASGTKPRPSRCCGICLHALTNHCAGCGKSTEGPEELAVYLGPDGRSRVVVSDCYSRAILWCWQGGAIVNKSS